MKFIYKIQILKIIKKIKIINISLKIMLSYFTVNYFHNFLKIGKIIIIIKKHLMCLPIYYNQFRF
jgi:hypothetical protein